MNITDSKLGFGTLVAVHETPPGVKEHENTGVRRITRIYQKHCKEGCFQDKYMVSIAKDGSDTTFFVTDKGTPSEQRKMSEKLERAGVTKVFVGNGPKLKKVIKKWTEGTIFEKVIYQEMYREKAPAQKACRDETPKRLRLCV